MTVLAVVASPYAGDVVRNVAYAQACMKDSLGRGEVPFAPHLLYPQILDDDDEGDRMLGINSGMSWMALANVLAVYSDLGISSGMAVEIKEAMRVGVHVEHRSLGISPEQPELGVEELIESLSKAERAMHDALHDVTAFAAQNGDRRVWQARKLLANGSTAKAIALLIEMLEHPEPQR